MSNSMEEKYTNMKKTKDLKITELNAKIDTNAE